MRNPMSPVARTRSLTAISFLAVLTMAGALASCGWGLCGEESSPLPLPYVRLLSCCTDKEGT